MHRRERVGRKQGLLAQARLRVAKILEPDLPGGQNHFRQHLRRVILRQFVVVQKCGRMIENPLRFVLHRAFVGFAAPPSLDLVREKRTRAFELRLGILELLRHIDQHVPDRLAQARARVHVVADDREPLAGEALCDDAKERLAHLRRNPGVDAVREDVIEAAERGVELDEVQRVKAGVGAAAGLRRGAGPRDRLPGQVDADKFRLRRAERHVDEVDALAAADLQDARAGERGERASEQRGEHADRRRVDDGEGQAGVADAVVSVRQVRVSLSDPGGTSGPEIAPSDKLFLPLEPRPARRRRLHLRMNRRSAASHLANPSFSKWVVQRSYSSAAQSKVACHSTKAWFVSTTRATRIVAV